MFWAWQSVWVRERVFERTWDSVITNYLYPSGANQSPGVWIVFRTRVLDVVTQEEEYNDFVARLLSIQSGIWRKPTTDEATLALWPCSIESTQLKGEALDDVKLISVEKDHKSEILPCWPRDSVEPTHASTDVRASDKVHYGQLRSTDELVQSVRQLRSTDELGHGVGQLRGSGSPFIKQEHID